MKKLQLIELGHTDSESVFECSKIRNTNRPKWHLAFNNSSDSLNLRLDDLSLVQLIFDVYKSN